MGYTKVADDKDADEDSNSKVSSSVLLFVILGFAAVIGVASVHIIFSGIICFIIGFDFLTVIYVIAAAVTTGTVITMTLAILTSAYCILSFFISVHSSPTSKEADFNLKDEIS